MFEIKANHEKGNPLVPILHLRSSCLKLFRESVLRSSRRSPGFQNLAFLQEIAPLILFSAVVGLIYDSKGLALNHFSRMLAVPWHL